MRQTTKIILGIIISIFLLSFGFIISLSFITKGNDKQNSTIKKFAISQDSIISVDVKPFQTIRVEDVKIQDGGMYPKGTILLNPVIREEDRNKLFLPAELLRFVNIVSSNDTLIVSLKIDEINKQYSPDKAEIAITCGIDGFNFTLPTNVVDIVCNYSGINFVIRNHY